MIRYIYVIFHVMRILIFLLVLISKVSLSQDTITIYFDFGSSKIKNEYFDKLNTIRSNYDLAVVDSIQFIGYADSTGDINSNLKLSKKRAKNTLTFCKNVFDKTAYISILAKGESSKGNDALNRRVEIILYYPNEPLIQTDEIIENTDPKCFLVDFDALRYCNIRTITKRKKEYVYIEAMDIDYFHNVKHYYALRDYSGKTTTIKKINWKEKTTGKLWWKQKRLVAIIPKASFDKFQFFRLENAPCDGCSETILSKDTIILNIPIFYSDYFLMSNMQRRVRFFGGNEIKIRVPREYVDPNIQYYYGPTDNNSHEVYNLQWYTKRGKKNKLYYYTNLEMFDGKMPYIKQNRMTTICRDKNQWNYNNWNVNWMCMLMYGLPANEFQWNISPGVFYHNDTITAFLTTGISHSWNRAYTSLNAGLNSHISFYGNFNYNYSLFNFPLKSLSPGNKWETPNYLQTVYNYGRLYAGTELKTSFNKKYQSFLEGNIHLGLSIVRTQQDAFFPKFYFQSGISKDFLNRINSNVYPFVQVGMTINLNSILIRNIN